MASVDSHPVGRRVRDWVAQKLVNLSARIQPRPDEDPFAWEVSIVKVAAAAGSRVEAMQAVHELTWHLDVRTVRMILHLLAADVAWSKELGADTAVEWAEFRKFSLIVDGLNDE